MVGFFSTLVTLWCIWRISAWIWARRKLKKLHKEEEKKKKQTEAETRQEEQRAEREALGVSDQYYANRTNPELAFDKVCMWEGDTILRLVYRPVVPSLGMKVTYCAHKDHRHVERNQELSDIWVCHYWYGCVRMLAPAEGVWSPVIPHNSILTEGDVILELDTTSEAIRLWYEVQDKEQAERLRVAAEREKEEIARTIKERQRRHELEKQVRQELIDRGELFGEQMKRPPISAEVRDAVYRRDGGRCQECGATEDLQFDHIIPFSKGGATSVENLQLLCGKCNRAKSNKIG